MMTLPDVSQAYFRQALKKFASVAGAQWAERSPEK